ncbi:hypothetical protein B0T16DRAFT_455641 [Cercophora newfieldiana]|uniref:DUF6536 domain-containing protein n=1 Tax=Cercophora newfieldiana TaxID=92897 RepID=A0AA39YA31_9PEZI|nr:hypothetical protein B0T16DRAFT_455641 [Cercophora newfieldiana]
MAMVNTALVAVLTITLAVLVGLISKSSGSPTASFSLYQGSCATSSRINVGLHLVINIIAMGVVASSNFFMQVLNAPSRAEVDAAHRKRTMLEIGVQSASNMLHVSRFKIISALVFALSSVPIHLLFNSVVFQSDFLGGSWQMILAAEPFVNGSIYTLPGAYLAPSGFWPESTMNLSRNMGLIAFQWGFGEHIDLAEYTMSSSPVVMNITRAAKSASSWVRLDARECRHQYIACEPRRTYGDVVMIINTGNNAHTRGWARSEVVDTSVFDEDSADFWRNLNLLPPADQPNPLWYSAVCAASQDPLALAGLCRTTCGEMLGGELLFSNDCPAAPAGSKAPDTTRCKYQRLLDSPVFSNDANWTVVNDKPQLLKEPEPGFQRDAILQAQHRAGFDIDRFSQWEVEYCLAEDISNRCKVGVSGVLLLVVTICAAIKTVQCIVVLLRLKEDPLVTLGDAIESFLLRPDIETRNLCTLSSDTVGDFFPAKTEPGGAAMARSEPQPQVWKRRCGRLFGAIRPRQWFWAYGLFMSGIAVAVTFFCIALAQLADKDSSPDGEDQRVMTGFDHTYVNGVLDAGWMPKGELLPSVLLSNAPQLIVSINYFLYNAIWTRLHSELEWNAFSVAYRSLRVTSPKGLQTSTNRLQLPYLYSAPLIIGSILLHWLVSNSLYVLVIEGDYLQPGYQRDENALRQNIYINVGYSSGPMLAAILTCAVMVVLPVAFAYYRNLKGDMTLMGNNSLVISAACHPVRCAPGAGDKTRSMSPGIVSDEKLSLILSEEDFGIEHSEKGGLRLEERIALTRGKLKWGVVGGSSELEGGEGKVGHLAFAGEDEEVSAPREERRYQ